MRITHEWRERPNQDSSPEEKRKTWTGVMEVTFPGGTIRWEKIYWCMTRTGFKAYCFNWHNENYPEIISFENEHEMRRFQEDLRLQEENARAQTSTQAPSVR